MSDEIQTFEQVNIIRAVPHESKLPTVAAGHCTLSHEIVGAVERSTLENLLIEEGMSGEQVRNGFLFFDACLKRVVELAIAGYTVNTDWFRAALTIAGVVPMERLGHNALAGEVEVKVNFTECKRVRDMVEAMPVFIHEALGTGAPVIQGVKDATGTVADHLTIGEMAEVRGLNIAIRGNETMSIGVFFTPVAGGTATRIPADKCAPNTPSLVQFVTPAWLAPGPYHLSIATQMTHRTEVYTSEVRQGLYGKLVTVAAAAST